MAYTKTLSASLITVEPYSNPMVWGGGGSAMAFNTTLPDKMISHVASIDEGAMDGIAERLWKKMFDFPVLVVCAYCTSVNAVTNGTCLHCNGPLGDATGFQAKATSNEVHHIKRDKDGMVYAIETQRK